MAKRPRSNTPCLACMRWHPERPACDWNSEAKCRECGEVLGYKGDDEQGDEATCFYCWSGLPRPIAEVLPASSEAQPPDILLYADELLAPSPRNEQSTDPHHAPPVSKPPAQRRISELT